MEAMLIMMILMIIVALTIVVVTLCFKGLDDNVEGVWGRRAFGNVVEKLLDCFLRCRGLLRQGEKNVLKRLTVLKDVIDLNAEATDIHKAMCHVLEDGVALSFLQGDEIRSLQKAVKDLKQEFWDEKAEQIRVQEGFKQEIQNERVAMNKFWMEITQWRIEQEEEQEKRWKTQEKALEEHVKQWITQIGSLKMELKS